MCTAIRYNVGAPLFGRNLDVENHYGECIIVTPRNFTLSYRKMPNIENHYAIIGVGICNRGYPLYFDGANEHGLAMAGLNFMGNAKYMPTIENKINITPYEFIPYVLGSFKNVREAMGELGNINLTDIPFSREMPLSDLHWIIADKNEAITVEQTEDGLKIYENKIGILTNNPPFPFHLQNLAGYLNLTADEAYNRFSNRIDLTPYSRGMGAIGLPGDPSSASRFVRAAFSSLNPPKNTDYAGSVCQLFHILASVEQIEGTVYVGEKSERTDYSSVIDLNTLTYYYRTYTNSQICAIRLSEVNDERSLKCFPMNQSSSIYYHS